MEITKSTESQIIRIGRIKYSLNSWLIFANTKYFCTIRFLPEGVSIMYQSKSGGNILNTQKDTFNKAVMDMHKKLKELKK